MNLLPGAELVPAPLTRPSKKKIIKWLLISAVIFFIILLLIPLSSLISVHRNNNKIYPGVKINDLDLGGATKTQASQIISEQFKNIYGQGFNFQINQVPKNLPNENLLQLNLESLVEAAFRSGREHNWWRNSWTILTNPLLEKQIPIDYQLNKTLIKEKLQNAFRPYENPAQNADLILKIINKDTRQYTLNFSQSQAGQAFDYNAAIETLDAAIKKLQNPRIILTPRPDFPIISTSQAATTRPQLEKILSLPNINLNFRDKTWIIKWEDFAHWLKVDLNENEQASIVLDENMIKGQLNALAQEIDRPAVDAKFQIKNNRVTEFQASQNGQALNLEENYQKLSNAILNQQNNVIDLIVDIKEPKVSIANINDLGIREKIGEGGSDFSGSPDNRRGNIGVGAATLNGVLIPPNTEFSLVKTLGEIDAQHGYKPELVIKKNETTPEFGGGLCQIGTTMFRATLASGLPITERRNHSYRVVYYEPAGTDATIYNPSPDFKFINDTANYILIQSKLIGNTLTFEFWGTKDGRSIHFEGQNQTDNLRELKPQISNITKPGPAKEIETEELAPGVKKRTETAHDGADTVFYRTVTKNGESKKETWKSHYVPWQAVYLIGVDPAKKAQEAQIKSSETILPIETPINTSPATTPITN